MVRLMAMLIIFGAPNFGAPAQPEVRCAIRANLLDEDPKGGDKGLYSARVSGGDRVKLLE